MTVPSGFTDYIADALTSHIAGEADCGDFIMRRSDTEIVYVDPLEGELYLISVYPAEVIAKEGPSA